MTFINTSLSKDYENNLFTGDEYEFNIEMNLHTHDYELSINSEANELIRIYLYNTEEEALQDVLHLREAGLELI
jgi:hypothetical protein